MATEENVPDAPLLPPHAAVGNKENQQGPYNMQRRKTKAEQLKDKRRLLDRSLSRGRAETPKENDESSSVKKNDSWLKLSGTSSSHRRGRRDQRQRHGRSRSRSRSIMGSEPSNVKATSVDTGATAPFLEKAAGSEDRRPDNVLEESDKNVARATPPPPPPPPQRSEPRVEPRGPPKHITIPSPKHGKKKSDRRKSRETPSPRHHNPMIVSQAKDDLLNDDIQDDPRGSDPTRRITAKASSRDNGRNTESLDPASTLVRPDLRIHVGSNASPKFDKVLKHDDVVIVPELFGKENDWSLYYQLLKEMTDLQKAQHDDVKSSALPSADWISWHEGAHLISKNPNGSRTFHYVINRLCAYFGIAKDSISTRFNWYRDSSDWKPFHHDSAAFNPNRAKTQNITVGVSFGATRELAFVRANSNHRGIPSNTNDDAHRVRLYFPQTNNGVFSFGRDANILWKHGLNGLHPDEQDGKGRISIILWGLAENVVNEKGSPPLLQDGPSLHVSSRKRDSRNRHRRPRQPPQLAENNTPM